VSTAQLDLRPDTLTPRSVVAAAALLAAALGLLAEALANSAIPTQAVIWGGLALAAYAIGLMFLMRFWHGAGLARWRFGPWILVWYGITFGLATVTWSQPQVGPVAQIAVSSVLRALWLLAVGLSVWTLGYFVGPGRLARSAATRVVMALRRRLAAEVRSPAAPWILYAIGSAARLASAAVTGRFNYLGDASSALNTANSYGQILAVLNYWAPLAVAAAAMQVFRERLRGARITLTVLFLLELGVSIASADKENFVIAVVVVIVPYSASRRHLPKGAIGVIILAFLAVIIPFNATYRNVVRSGSITLTPAQAVSEAPGIFRQTLSAQNVVTSVPDSFNYLLGRIREIDTPAIIMQRTPGQIPFGSWLDLAEAPLLELVPRAIWPDKPILDDGYRVNQEYYGQPATSYSSDAVTPIGSLYQYGGWIPVIVGMFLFGIGVRLLDDVLDVRTNPHAIFLVVLLFPTVVAAEGDWVLLLASTPATLLSWVLALYLTFRRRNLA